MTTKLLILAIIVIWVGISGVTSLHSECNETITLNTSAVEYGIRDEELFGTNLPENIIPIGIYNDHTDVEYWTHTAVEIGHCANAPSFVFPWEPTNKKVCREPVVDNQIWFGRATKLKGALSCSWMICAEQNHYARVAFTLKAIKTAIDYNDGLTICVGCNVVGNGTLVGRVHYLIDNKKILQDVSDVENIVVVSHITTKATMDQMKELEVDFDILKYNPTCGGNYSDLKNGTISSPGHPEFGLPRNFFCRYEIRVAAGERIKFTVNYFRLDSEDSCSTTRMLLRDGLDLMFPFVRMFCGEKIPPATFQSYHSSVEISINARTTVDKNLNGYSISWFDVPIHEGGINDNESKPVHEPDVDKPSSACLKFNGSQKSEHQKDWSKIECDGTFIVDNGNFKLDWPQNLRENSSCMWTLCGADVPGNVENKRIIMLSLFEHFNRANKNLIELCEDCALSISGREFVGGHKHKCCAFTGNSEKPSLMLYGEVITIKFEGSIGMNLDGYVEVLDYNPDDHCQMSYTTASGTITSPAYPKTYPNYVDCNWDIIVPNGYLISFTVVDFEIPADEKFNAFYFRDGMTTTIPIIKKYTKKSPPPKAFTSATNNVAFQLMGSLSDSKNRFKIAWERKAAECQDYRTTFSGTIQSPGYPKYLKPGTFCTWNITVNLGYAIKINVIEISIGNGDRYRGKTGRCLDNYVKISNGRIEDDLQFDVMCSTKDADGKLVTKSNTLQIELNVSDVSTIRKGIHISYTSVCMDVQDEFSGIIESIYFPFPHYFPFKCSWEIRGSIQDSIKLNFTTLHSNANRFFRNSYVKRGISVLECAPGCKLRKQTVIKPSMVTIEEKSTKIEYSSYNSERNVIFRVEWWIEGCVTTLRGSTGIVNTPKYPGRYSNDVNCRWQIITDPRTKVQLTLHDWQIEKSKDCQFDVLKIYGGSSEKSPLLTVMCGEIGKDQYKAILTSRHNTMFLKFTSDNTNGYRGFNGTFRQIEERRETSHYVNSYGYLYSPNYPHIVDVVIDHIYVVRVGPTFNAAIKILDYEMFSYHICLFNNFKVYGGNNTLHLESCRGTGLTGFVVKTSGNKIILEFRSKENVGYRGFMAVYYQTCGATLTSEYGTLASPDFMTVTMMPENYICDWKLEANMNHKVALIFTNLTWSIVDERCSGHHVQVLEHSTAENSLSNITTHYYGCCGPVPAPILSNGNALTLEVLGIEYLQFTALYVVLTPECILQLETQQRTMSTTFGEDRCHRTIKYNGDEKMQITFRSLSRQSSIFGNNTKSCDSNFVEIYKHNITEESAERFCGEVVTTTQGNTMVVYIVYTRNENEETSKHENIDIGGNLNISVNGNNKLLGTTKSTLFFLMVSIAIQCNFNSIEF